MTAEDLPLAQRSSEDLPGHWLLARLGKRVLRPGGRAMTEQMVADAAITGADVLELAPGLGRTARLILDGGVDSYVGVESDDAAAALTKQAIGDQGDVVVADAAATGLADASRDVAIGEAMLTMQTDRAKAAIIGEVARVLRPGGRYALHELALQPDTLDEDVKTDIRRALARSIKVNARPLTADEWRTILQHNGFEIEKVSFAPMALLQPRRMIADEGPLRTLRIAINLLRDGSARKRVLAMRATFRKHREHLAAIEVIAVKRGG